MPETSIQPTASSGGALSAEHYQTFEMAKANDGVIGGSNIAELRSYSAAARAQAQVIHKTIASLGSFEEVAAARAEAIETEQTYARVSIYADQRIGELLRELPKGKGNQYQQSAEVGMPTKAQAERDAGISHAISIDLQAMAANPDVVQAVLDKAEAEGRIPSRKQVLDAIRERDDARETVSMVKRVGDTLKEQRDKAQADLERAREEIKALERQNDQLYEQANAASAPQVVERTVEVPSASDQRRIKELEHLEQLHSSDNAKLRRKLEETRQELDRAKDILGLDASMREVQSDVQYLIAATNQYVRRYGGLTWTVERLADVDDVTREELRKAVKNLATFSSALMASLESFNG